MESLAILLPSATARYRALAEALGRVDLVGSFASGGNLAEVEAYLTPFQEAAQEADHKLHRLLDAAEDAYQDLPRLLEYQEVLRQVAELNGTLLSRARTHLAVVASELAELKDGKAALAGYRAPTEQRGRMLSETF